MTDKEDFDVKQLDIVFLQKEYEVLQRKIKMSGLTKQDYMIHCMENQNVIICGSPYVYRSLKNELNHFIALVSKFATVG